MLALANLFLGLFEDEAANDILYRAYDRKVVEGLREALVTKVEEAIQPIQEVIVPKMIEDLVIHSKARNQILKWFQRFERLKIMLLTGPSGCGKLTAVKIIAGHLGYNVDEYVYESETENHFSTVHNHKREVRLQI